MPRVLVFLIILTCWHANAYIRWTPTCKKDDTPVDPEECMFSPEIIHNRWGYPAMVYEVTTSDGYILTVFRIPHGKKGQDNCIKPVVFLMHGLLGSSDTFLTNLPNEGLPFILADAGYDVWIGNVRGSRYSRAHVTLDPDKGEAYWDFSWDEMAARDLPAMIDKALEVTGQAQLDYIAHSQGTLIGFAKFSEDQQFSKKIRTFYALAPVSSLAHITTSLKDFASPWIMKTIQKLFNLDGVYEFGTSDGPDRTLSKYFCLSELHWQQDICENVILWFEGFNKRYTNDSRMPVYLSHTPAGTSIKNLVHFAQNIASKKMQKYDYGFDGNMEYYGQKTPPEYHVENIKVPTVVFCGGADSFADPRDVAILMRKISPVLKQYYFYKDFMHLDFTYGLGAYKEVYPHILALLAENTKSVKCF